MTAIELVVLAICFLGAFFFAGSETGFVTWNALKISHRASLGDFRGRWAVFLMARKNRLLSAVLVGNNLCIVGASLTFEELFFHFDKVFPLDLSFIESPEPWILSPLMVVFAEMLPKSLFRIYSFRLTIRAVPILMAVYWATLPVTWLFALVGSLGRRGRDQAQSFTTKMREEMVLVAFEGFRRGTLFQGVNVLIERTLKLRGRIGDAGSEHGMVAEEPPARCTETVAGILGRGALPDRDEFLVYDGEGRLAVGSVRVLDLAKAGRDDKLKAIMRPLGQRADSVSIVDYLSGMGTSPRFWCLTGESGACSGTFDRLVLARSLFSGIDPA
jgi:hypothetical protein